MCAFVGKGRTTVSLPDVCVVNEDDDDLQPDGGRRM